MQVKRRKGEDAEEAEEEERALSTIANLFQGLSRGSRRDRLAAKFVENEFEKCDRLLELYSRYNTRQRAAEVQTTLLPLFWKIHPLCTMMKSEMSYNLHLWIKRKLLFDKQGRGSGCGLPHIGQDFPVDMDHPFLQQACALRWNLFSTMEPKCISRQM